MKVAPESLTYQRCIDRNRPGAFSPETVFIAYMTFRAFAGRGRNDAPAFTDSCERGMIPLKRMLLIPGAK